MQNWELSLREVFFEILGELSVKEISSNLKLMSTTEEIGKLLAV